MDNRRLCQIGGSPAQLVFQLAHGIRQVHIHTGEPEAATECMYSPEEVLHAALLSHRPDTYYWVSE